MINSYSSRYQISPKYIPGKCPGEIKIEPNQLSLPTPCYVSLLLAFCHVEIYMESLLLNVTFASLKKKREQLLVTRREWKE